MQIYNIVICNENLNMVLIPMCRATDMSNCSILSLCTPLWKQGSDFAVKGSVLGL